MWGFLIWTLLTLHQIRAARAQDDVSPYFKTEPVRTQVHLEGNRLVLTCMAEGSWPLEFKWLHNNRELTKFSLEYRYMITSLDRTHAGFYRCIVRNRMGALLQRQTEVQVALGFLPCFGSPLKAPELQVPPDIVKTVDVTEFHQGHAVLPSCAHLQLPETSIGKLPLLLHTALQV
ncbi:PREDICTED: protein sidekick-2-like [Cercocebus atys]|uniref:protein sidekick-2-like n=1 Tax=Cercocebus atys TaxID=9531 RepID=UPI0005F46551|nr:PREDICTED: protein sidekick-2-like [Cercocebus atys]